MLKLILRAGLCGILLAAASPAGALRVETLDGFKAFTPAGDEAPALKVTAGEALVKFSSVTTSYAERAAAVGTIGGTIIGEFMPDHWTHVALPAGMSVREGLDKLALLPGALKVKPNHVFTINKLPSDPQVLSQYHLNKINAFAAWEYDVGNSNNVTVAVMDTGVDFTHPDLAGKKIAGANRFCGGADCNTVDADDKVACNHGTRVAGTAAASGDNGTDGAGVTWGAKIVSLRIFDDDADGGGCRSDCSNVSGVNKCDTNETRMRHAIDHVRTVLLGSPGVGRIVVNMSIGGTCECGSSWDLVTGAVSASCDSGDDSLIIPAFANAANAGIILIAAAGNYSDTSNGGPVQAPGRCPNVMPVGATDENDNVAGFSARGSSLAAHGVVAPGVNILTTDVGGGMASATGTSFSAPIVAGVAALIMSAAPAISTAAVKNAIRNSADGIGVSSLGLSRGVSGSTAGAGRLNAFKAVRYALGKTEYEGDEKAIAFPNPFRPAEHGTSTLTIPTWLQGKNPRVRIYTIDGLLVRDLGANTTWEGRSDNGIDVATGVYIFVVKTDKGEERGRVAVIR